MSKQIKCQLTGKLGKGVKSHIIPKSFYELSKDKGMIKALSTVEGIYPRKVPVGIYDSKILTREGEDVFAQYDDLGAKVLLGESCDIVRRETDRGLGYYLIGCSNFNRLKIFFLSVLWRAHVSERPEFSPVSLGERHSTAIRKIIIDETNLALDDYSFVLSRWKGGTFNIVMDPIRGKVEGVNFYTLYMGRYQVMIKVDSRPAPSELRDYLALIESGILALELEPRDSPEFPVLQEIARLNSGAFPSEA